jgi:hypothetical protein
LINEIIQKLVKLDPNERADYHEIGKYPEISKHFKNVVGITEYDKLNLEIEMIDRKLESTRT